MAVKNVSHLNHDWRPRTLRFAHWGGGGQVGFSGDAASKDGRSSGLLHGHGRESAFAVLVHLHHHHPSLSVEVDGVRVHGVLGKPDDRSGRAPFAPKPYRDGSVPSPTRPIGYVRWVEGRHRFLAECRVTQETPDSAWEVAAPYAVEADTQRLLPRVTVPRDWSFRPGRAGTMPFDRAAPLADVSLTGAGLLVEGKWEEGDFREPFLVGALHHPSGKQLSLRVHVVHARDHSRGTLLGVSFSMVGLYGLRRLGRWISDR